MCELDLTDFTVPEGFITGLEFHVLPVSVKYLQEGFFWKFVNRHPLRVES